jgi:cyclopropane-fatty-acyl-phospholipid synthase
VEKLLRIFLNENVKQGAADIESPGDAFRVGDGGEPCCAVHFADERAALSLIRNPEFAFGELYMNGKINVVRGTIYDTLALITRNIAGCGINLRSIIRHE